MKELPLVSIVMPVFNNELYIGYAIQDLIEQSYPFFEVICVDDGSTDDTIEIINNFIGKDSRIKLIHQEHKGAGEARNYGFTKARGKYTLFLDSDDRFEKDILKETVSAAEENKTDILLFDAARFDNKTGDNLSSAWIIKRALLPDTKVFSYKDCPGAILNISFTVPWNKLYRTEFIENHKLKFQNTPYLNDVYFVQMSMIFAKRICFIDRKLVRYRANLSTATTSSSVRDRNPLMCCKVFNLLKEELKKIGVCNKLWESFIDNTAEHLIGSLEMATGQAYFQLYNVAKRELFEELQVKKRIWTEDLYKVLETKINQFEKMDAIDYLFFLQQYHHKLLDRAGGVIEEVVEDNQRLIADNQRLIADNRNIVKHIFNMKVNKKWILIDTNIIMKRKIVLYGAGDVGNDLYEQFEKMKNAPDIIAWVDRNYQKIANSKHLIKSPEIIKNLQFDYIVIAVAEQQVYEQIVKWLLKFTDEKKIVHLDFEKAQRMQENESKK